MFMILLYKFPISEDFDASGNPCSVNWNWDFSLTCILEVNILVPAYPQTSTHSLYCNTHRLSYSWWCFLRNSLLKYSSFGEKKTKQNKTPKHKPNQHFLTSYILLLQAFSARRKILLCIMEEKSFLSTEEKDFGYATILF